MAKSRGYTYPKPSLSPSPLELKLRAFISIVARIARGLLRIATAILIIIATVAVWANFTFWFWLVIGTAFTLWMGYLVGTNK